MSADPANGGKAPKKTGGRAGGIALTCLPAYFGVISFGSAVAREVLTRIPTNARLDRDKAELNLQVNFNLCCGEGNTHGYPFKKQRLALCEMLCKLISPGTSKGHM